jgi:Concanavalin A-like lectin/glucanases superfamily/Glycosyl hydrolases family 43/Secretion system C-terminal sorting domain
MKIIDKQKAITIIFFLMFNTLINSLYAQWSSFTPGLFWNDTAGNRIEAHGAGFIQIDSVFYWIGEDKSHNMHIFKGVNCYSSTDLMNWTFRNSIITRETDPDLNSDSRVIERPKVIYNDSTKTFVMWLHYESSNYGAAEAGVFTSSTIDGDYKLIKHFRPNNNMSRDCNLFKDDDGTAYFFSAANENADMVIYELTADYLDIKRQVIVLWPGSWREAPAMFKKNGIYYLITSGATGWDPNQAKYATAESIEGPWSALKNFGDNIAFDSQSTYILPVYGSQDTTYIYCGDRWQDPDLLSSKYIWLPLTVGNSTISMQNRNLWQLNMDQGMLTEAEGTVPEAPSNLALISKSFSRIEIAWNDNSVNEGGFEINRKQGDNDWQVVGKAGINVTDFLDIQLEPAKHYSYSVNAFNAAGKSELSAEIIDSTEAISSDSLIGYWTFDKGTGDTCYDASVFSNNGVLKGSPQWVEGIAGTALQFNGTSSYVTFENAEIFDVSKQITIAAWVRQYDAANSQHNPWITKGDHAFALKHQEGNNYEFFIYGNDNWQVVRTPAMAGHNNSWHHFAGTFDGNVLKIYMDGQKKTSTNFSGEINYRPNDMLNFGRNSEATDRFFNGVMDEVKIFNVALNEQQIQDMYYENVNSISKEQSEMPLQMILYNNYPNPFNPETEINYQIGSTGAGGASQHVNLTIYNLLGKKVTTLVSEKKPAGNYSVSFNASNLASGIYFYRLQTAHFSQTKKMILLR